MEQIAENVYIERSFPRVVLGAIRLEKGMLVIDSPFRAIDVPSWQSQLRHLSSGGNKLRVILDAHIDRTISIREMELTTLGHENTLDYFHASSTSASSQEVEPGPDWVHNELPIGSNCYKPDIIFSDKVLIHWGEDPVEISHKPGASTSSLWIIYDAAKVIFIGDSVVINQPPFFAYADIDCWIEELIWLKSDRFRDFTIVSSRNGVINPESVTQMITFLETTKKILTEGKKQENLTNEILQVTLQLMKEINFDEQFKDRYQNRLIWGLQHYLQSHHSESESQPKGIEA